MYVQPSLFCALPVLCTALRGCTHLMELADAVRRMSSNMLCRALSLALLLRPAGSRPSRQGHTNDVHGKHDSLGRADASKFCPSIAQNTIVVRRRRVHTDKHAGLAGVQHLGARGDEHRAPGVQHGGLPAAGRRRLRCPRQLRHLRRSTSILIQQLTPAGGALCRWPPRLPWVPHNDVYG